MTETVRKWKIGDIGSFCKRSLVAIVKGEFLLRLDIGRYFMHILYAFLLAGLAIWVSLRIDMTLTKVEKNRATITELEISNSQKEYELMRLERRTTVSGLLKEMGSEVTDPGKPANVIRK